MKKYVLIDTNVLINCCLYSENNEDVKVLRSLKDAIILKKFTFLLPEVIELEFKRIAYKRFEDFKQNLVNYEENIYRIVQCYPRAKAEINSFIQKRGLKKKLQDIISDLQKNFEQSKKIVEQIFENKNTCRIAMDEKILLEAYKRGIAGKKPYKPCRINNEDIYGAVIQADCVIVETVKSFLKDEKDYLLFICTNNKGDFGKGDKIHEDIASDFEKVKIYSFLYKLLNKEFKTKIEEEKLTLTSFLNSTSPLISKSLTYSVSLQQKFCKKCGALISPSVLSAYGDPDLCNTCKISFSNFCDGGIHNCSVCGNLYASGITRVDDGKCDGCRTSTIGIRGGNIEFFIH